MSFRWMRMAAILLGLAPAAAAAFETVDEIPFPSLGRFPAWEGDAPRPWNLFGYAGVMYDTNAFRRDTDERGDVVARYGLGGRAEQRVFGRQRLAVEGFGEYYDFNELSEIDHFGYGLRGDWLWEIGNQLNGAAVYSRRRRHADLGEFRTETRSMLTIEQLLFDGGYRFHPDWRLYGAVDQTRSRREDDEAADLDTTTVRGRLTYSTPLGNALGVEARAARGNTQFSDDITGIPVTNDFDEREIAAVLSYALGATLRVSGRLGYTERVYDDIAGRNFNGTTYRGLVDWLPTVRLSLSLEAFRFPQSIPDVSASHALRTGAIFRASYAATYKLVFTMSFSNEHRVAQGSPEAEILGTPVTDETLRVWRFGVGWEPQRHWQLGAGVDVGDRSSNILGRNYEYAQAMLNARWIW